MFQVFWGGVESAQKILVGREEAARSVKFWKPLSLLQIYWNIGTTTYLLTFTTTTTTNKNNNLQTLSTARPPKILRNKSSLKIGTTWNSWNKLGTNPALLNLRVFFILPVALQNSLH
jgi:hypothetical protein